MHAYFGLNVDTGCPKLLHSPDMHEVVTAKPDTALEPSLNRNQKNLTAFILGTLVASPVVLSSACGGARSVSPSPAVGSFAVSPACQFSRSVLLWRHAPRTRPASVCRRVLKNIGRRVFRAIPSARSNMNTLSTATSWTNKPIAPGLPRIDIRTFSIADPDSLQLPAEAQEASVPVRIQYQYVFPIPGVKPMLMPTTIHDRWKKQHGVWYHDLAARGGAGSKKTH